MAHLPNAEMAIIAWLKTVPGVPSTKVATTVPADLNAWKDTGFVQVFTVGGSPGVHVPMRAPVLQISAWAVSPNSQKTPWGQAQALAERVFSGFYNPDLFPVRVTFGGLDYRPAQIHTGYPLSEPQKIPGSESGYAQVRFDATISWVAA